jgi:hypothetical protein
MSESRRVKAFRLGIAKQIPKFPNNKATLKVLQSKSLGALLIDYANWAIRYVAPRPRRVVVEPSATSDPRWQSLYADIQKLLSKVQRGDDLTPHLSLQPHTRGFTPASSGPGSNVDRWADKDMLLNVMGYHHFHFDAAPHSEMRSDDVLFAHVTRDMFTAVGIFDHSAFEQSLAPGTVMTAERQRLWKLFEERATRGMPSGSVVVLSPIALSGHSLYFSNIAKSYARLITQIDPKMDDLTYIRSLYQQANRLMPARPKLRWQMYWLDLCVVEQQSSGFFSVGQGPN